MITFGAIFESNTRSIIKLWELFEYFSKKDMVDFNKHSFLLIEFYNAVRSQDNCGIFAQTVIHFFSQVMMLPKERSTLSEDLSLV